MKHAKEKKAMKDHIVLVWRCSCVGGEHALWHAKKDGVRFTGAGNTADNAIKDLQAQINHSKG